MLNSIGLIIDIIGVLLVFFNSPEVSSKVFVYSRAEAPARERKARNIRRRSRAGLLLIGVGFLVQLCSNLI